MERAALKRPPSPFHVPFSRAGADCQAGKRDDNQVHTQYKDAENHYGSDLLNLVLAKGYLAKLLANQAVKAFVGQQAPEILGHFELVVNTVSMEEAVEQQQTVNVVLEPKAA